MSGQPPGTTDRLHGAATRDPGSTPGTPADGLDQIRRSLSDLKYDVRMLKVGLDKQGQKLDRLATALEELTNVDEEE